MLVSRRGFYKIFPVFLVMVNFAAVAGNVTGRWPLDEALYFYWSECALLAGLSVMLFAKRLIVFFVILMAAAGMIYLVSGIPVIGSQITLIFWALYSLCWLAYIELGQSGYGLLIKRLHPVRQLIIYLLFMFAAIGGCMALTLSIFKSWHFLLPLSRDFFALFMGLAIGVPTVSISLLRVIDMIGPKHFLQFLIGTYHRPSEHERIVLFLDMVNSSGVAEKLQPKQSMSLIARFIFDATATFRLHGGDIVQYTGDGLFVIWPYRQADRVLTAVQALRQRLDNNKPVYLKEFGIVPDFRIGLHAGTVVISQIGEEKLFLGVYGDVVNTAARLEQMNKDLHTKILMSDVLVRNLSPAWHARLQPLGPQPVRGRNETVDVFTLRKAA